MRLNAGFLLTALLGLTAIPMGVLSAMYFFAATQIFFDNPHHITLGQITFAAVPLSVAIGMIGGAWISFDLWKRSRWKSWSFPIATTLAALTVWIVWRVAHMTLR